MSYSLTVTESGGLTLGLTGPAGPAGPAGPSGSAGSALTFDGDNPNVPELMTVALRKTSDNSILFSGTLTSLPDLFNGKITYAGLGEIIWDGVKWEFIESAFTSRYTSTADVIHPGLIPVGPWDADSNPHGWRQTVPPTDETGDTPVTVDVQPIEITAGPSLQGTHIGQLCKTPTAWWRWDGDVWEEDVSITGNQTITGEKTFDDNVTFNANINAANIYGLLFGSIVGNIQSLSGAGAVDNALLTTLLTTTEDGQVFTLANGDHGQIKIVILDVKNGNAVLTPTSTTGYTTITFDDPGESATLQFVATRGWIILSLRGAVAA